MRVQGINNYQQNSPSFNARLELAAKKSSLPKGAPERLQKLARTIGTDADTITIGIMHKIIKRTVKGFDTFGRFEYPELESVSTIIAKACFCHSKKLVEPHAANLISDSQSTNVVKYINSKDIKMNNYKAVYKYLLDLKENFKPSL